MNFRTFFIQTWSSGEGIKITCDDRWTIRKDNIFINPYTGVMIVEYLFDGQIRTSKTSCESFDDITIKEIFDEKDN